MADEERGLRFAGERYALTFLNDCPFVYLDIGTHRVAELFVPGSVHPWEGRDDTTELSHWGVGERPNETVFTLRASSSVWSRKIYAFVCSPQRFTFETAVEGTGRLADVNYFGGYSSAQPRWGSGFFLSGQHFRRGFNPEPNTADRPYFDPSGAAVIDLVGAPLPGRRHWLFTPPPFCFSFETAAGWIALGVEARPGQNQFTEYRYHGQDAFYLALAFEGYTQIRGEYRLPRITVDVAGDEYGALEAHVAGLRASRSAPAPQAPKPNWWRRPIFCGWGAQCDLAAREHGYAPTGDSRVDGAAFLATMRYAGQYARQDTYERFLSALNAHDIVPGTVVIDDKWQLTYGENAADPEKFPDLRAFVDCCHARGQHVLLWLKAWDREGVPDTECICNADDQPLTIDPTNPQYEHRLRASVRRMLCSTGYDADGFKVDFSHRIPQGPGMRVYGQAWGLELMKRYLGILYEEAKAVKPDALIMTHTPHPYLADVLDMIRLNDMQDLSILDDPSAPTDIESTITLRARVARIACPEALIDTDNWPVRSKRVWREYVRLQPRFGVPSLYFATHIDLTQEPLEDDDYDFIRETWHGIDPGNRGKVA